jgi:hypothetical protein
MIIELRVPRVRDGGFFLVCWSHASGRSERWWHSMELLANEVMPRLTDLTAVESESASSAAH